MTATPTAAACNALPALPLEEWEETKETLHRFVQVVGKVRLAASPPRNHWWHASLAVTARGLSTGPMPHAGGTFAIDFDFVDHRATVASSVGTVESFPLEDGLSVARFYDALFARLRLLGIEAAIRPVPFALTPAVPFPEDTGHAAYDRAYANRWWRLIAWTAPVFEAFAGRFTGKTSPVHLFWHSFDLAVTRFSGRRAPEQAGVDPVNREAYSHEVISFGFWPGDARLRFPAFYSYTAPEPPGLTDQPLRPAAASWSDTGRGSLALLPYDALRGEPAPREALLAFLESAYQAGAQAAGWDRAEFATGPKR